LIINQLRFFFLVLAQYANHGSSQKVLKLELILL